jgi:hypothetical protein
MTKSLNALAEMRLHNLYNENSIPFLHCDLAVAAHLTWLLLLLSREITIENVVL